jgi:hypothetical protein
VALDAHAFGYDPDPAGAEAFASTLPRPTLAQAGPDLVADGKTETHLWPALLQCSPGWKRGSQGMVGSCVGWGASLAVDLTSACDIVYRREPEVWRGRTIESSLYAFSRVEARGKTVNNGGDGSTGFHAAKAIREFGCLHYGVEYGSVVIAESGKQERDRSWGRNGVPNELEPYAKERRCSEVTLVVDFEQAAAAIQNGYPVVVCSGQGFSMSRDADGFCKPGGTWWHCMVFAAVRWGKRPGLLCRGATRTPSASTTPRRCRQRCGIAPSGSTPRSAPGCSRVATPTSMPDTAVSGGRRSPTGPETSSDEMARRVHDRACGMRGIAAA